MNEINLQNFKICAICNSQTDDPVVLGDFITSGNMTVHYFCVLLSTNLPQRGKDKQGILGFLLTDIRKEIKESSTKGCFYCKLKGASIACYACEKYFHVKCGFDMNCVSEFTDRFASYCHEHHKINAAEYPYVGRRECYICSTSMGMYNPVTHVRARCCGRGYVHLICLRKYALAAGYYLRCLWCRSPEFREIVKLQSVFVPDREAQWERNKAFYADLHRGHSECNAKICKCPKGRNHTDKNWKIILCSLCGSFGVHNPYCLKKKKPIETIKIYKCKTCFISSERDKSRTTLGTLKYENNNIDYSLFMSKSFAEFQEDFSYPEFSHNSHLENIPFEETNDDDSEKLSIVYKEVYIFKNGYQVGTGKARIDFSDPRFRGRSLQDINSSELNSTDIVERTNETPLIDLAHEIAMAHIAKSRNKEPINILSSDEENDISPSDMLKNL